MKKCKIALEELKTLVLEYSIRIENLKNFENNQSLKEKYKNNLEGIMKSLNIVNRIQKMKID